MKPRSFGDHPSLVAHVEFYNAPVPKEISVPLVSHRAKTSLSSFWAYHEGQEME